MKLQLLKILVFLFIFNLVLISSSFSIQKQLFSNMDNKVYYYLAKKEFYNKHYVLADYFFSKLIKNNNLDNKYFQKSRIYAILVKIKTNNFRYANFLSESLLLDIKILKKKYANYVYYTAGFTAYNYFRTSFNKFFFVNRYKSEWILAAKSFDSLKKIKKLKKYNNIFEKTFCKVTREVKINAIHIANYYLKKKAYISVIKRIGDFKKIRKTKYGYYRNYLLMRTYNEMYLNDLSKKLLKIL